MYIIIKYYGIWFCSKNKFLIYCFLQILFRTIRAFFLLRIIYCCIHLEHLIFFPTETKLNCPHTCRFWPLSSNLHIYTEKRTAIFDLWHMSNFPFKYPHTFTLSKITQPTVFILFRLHSLKQSRKHKDQSCIWAKIAG